MRSPFQRFFKLILRVAFELASDVIYERFIITKVLLWKDLELGPGYRNYFTVILALVLSPLVADGPSKKRNYKWNTLWASSPNCVKVIFTLLTKVIAIHMRFPQYISKNLTFEGFSFDFIELGFLINSGQAYINCLINLSMEGEAKRGAKMRS